jgi:hypothetical protein
MVCPRGGLYKGFKRASGSPGWRDVCREAGASRQLPPHSLGRIDKVHVIAVTKTLTLLSSHKVRLFPSNVLQNPLYLLAN